MALLPDLNLLAQSGLNGLEQYLAWALTEMRRLAIAEGQQQVVRLTMSVDNVKEQDENRFEGLLRSEVNLNYDSEIALNNGLNFLEAIKDVSTAQAQLPEYVCSDERNTEIYYLLRGIASRPTPINSLEKLLYWMCLSWHKSKFSILDNPNDSSFAFFDENSNGGTVRFQFSIPFDYELALSKNIVCATYQSPWRSPLIYDFVTFNKSEVIEPEPVENYDAGNDSNYDNNSELKN